MDNSTLLALNLAESHGAADPEIGLLLETNYGAEPGYGEDLYRIYFLRSGEARLTLNHRNLILTSNQMLTLSPGDSVRFSDWAPIRSFAFHHNFFCVRVQRDEVFCDGVVFNRLQGLPVVRFPDEEGPVVESRFSELEQICRNTGPFTQDRSIAALRSLLLHTADFKMRETSDDGCETEVAHLSDFVLKFQHLVENTFLDKKDMEFYSSAMGVTEATLNRRLKAELDMTALQAVNERIALEARVALRTGTKSVKEVAFDLGFTDPLYFSRFFKKYFGMSPSQYFAKPLAQR